jgi:hypothetical protein
LDLQLPMQSVPITTDIVSSNSTQADVLEISLCDKDCQWLGTVRGFPLVLTMRTRLQSINQVKKVAPGWKLRLQQEIESKMDRVLEAISILVLHITCMKSKFKQWWSSSPLIPTS